MIADMQRRMSMRGLKKQDSSELFNKFYDLYKEEASKIVKTVLLIKSIAEKESLSVSDSEVDEKIKEIAEHRAQSYDSLKKSLVEGNLIEDMKSEILNTKVFRMIEDKAKITVVKK
jgi:trigger factor